MARALALAAGHSLDPLPPEAFELRRERSRSAPADEPDPAVDDAGGAPAPETATTRA
jgi:hypothetical protein